MSDPLPVALRLKHRLIGKKAALRQIHFPENRTQMLQARKRLAYEEVLRLQIEMMRLRRAETRDGEPTAHVPGQRMDELRAQLPYTLTSEQEQAIADIVDDMAAPRSMNPDAREMSVRARPSSRPSPWRSVPTADARRP